MTRALNPREIRTLKLGALALVVVVAMGAGPKVRSHIRDLQEEVQLMKGQLALVKGDLTPRQAGILKVVPAFEMPKAEEPQKYVFRERLAEQFKKAGFKEEPLRVEKPGTRKVGGYKCMNLNYQGKCKFDQILNVLVALKENPYYAGIEELIIKCDPKKAPEQRKEIDFEMTVSTLVK